MDIKLTQQETEALKHCLDNYLPELRYDMSRVKLPRDRHDMVVFEEALTRLRRRLDEAPAVAPPPIPAQA